MLSFAFILTLVILLIVGVVTVVLWRRHRSAEARSIVALYPQLKYFSFVTMVLRYLGVLLALICLYVLYEYSPIEDGRIVVLIPAAVGSLVVVFSTVGELAMFNAARQVGVASMEPRRIGSWLPKGLLILTGIAAVVFILLIVGSWLIADPDGRGFTLTGAYQGKDLFSVTTWPIFGAYYAEPMVVATGVFLILSCIGGLVVARRPRNGADPVLAQWDDALRRRSFRGLTATTLAVLSIDVLMVSLTNASALDFLIPQVGANAELNGVPASQIVIKENLLWYGWPGMKVFLWIIAFASFISFIYSTAIVLYDTASPQSSKVPR